MTTKTILHCTPCNINYANINYDNINYANINYDNINKTIPRTTSTCSSKAALPVMAASELLTDWEVRSDGVLLDGLSKPGTAPWHKTTENLVKQGYIQQYRNVPNFSDIIKICCN